MPSCQECKHFRGVPLQAVGQCVALPPQVVGIDPRGVILAVMPPALTQGVCGLYMAANPAGLGQDEAENVRKIHV